MKNTSSKKIRVAVVGGGSVGISYLSQLVEEAIRSHACRHLEICLFEPQRGPGPGYAYQHDFECNLLNTRADAMSAVAGDKQHFMRWLAGHAPDFPSTVIDENAFLPRSLFGRYLADHFEATLALAREHGIAFTHVASEVTDLIALGDHAVCLDTADAGAHLVDQVVLCIGNLPSTNFPHLNGLPGYQNSPYPTRAMVGKIPQAAPVCILGTGLSAIDTVLSLVESGHRGKIILASRNGRLPSVRGVFNKPHTLERLTRKQIDALAGAGDGALRLDDVFALLQQEVEGATGLACDLGEILNADAGILDYLSSEIVLASSAERLWQSVIYSTNSVIDYVWHRLSVEDKRRFQKTFGSLWSSYRVSFPVKNAHKLHTLLRSDRALVFGGVRSAGFNEATQLFETRIHDAQTGFRSVIESEYLVNATGYSVHTAHSEVPLVKNLLRRRLAVASEFGGFELDFETGRLVGPRGTVAPNVSVLGSLAAGTYFWTNAMDVNARLARQQAVDTVATILQRSAHAQHFPAAPRYDELADVKLPHWPVAPAQHYSAA